jgi:hypothetical protein
VLYFTVFGCYWGELDDWQKLFGGAVAVREALYALSVLAALCGNPDFLLVDVGASVRDTDAGGVLGGYGFLALYSARAREARGARGVPRGWVRLGPRGWHRHSAPSLGGNHPWASFRQPVGGHSVRWRSPGHPGWFCMVTPIVSTKHRYLYQFCFVKIFSTNRYGKLVMLDDPGHVTC